MVRRSDLVPVKWPVVDTPIVEVAGVPVPVVEVAGVPVPVVEIVDVDVVILEYSQSLKLLALPIDPVTVKFTF
jgi:hypothetical protein